MVCRTLELTECLVRFDLQPAVECGVHLVVILLLETLDIAEVHFLLSSERVFQNISRDVPVDLVVPVNLIEQSALIVGLDNSASKVLEGTD